MDCVLFGFYKVKDKYFSDFPNKRHMLNKHENRPYYLAVKESNGIIWLIPISSKVEKYEAKISADEAKFGECLMYHVIQFMGEKRAALIGNMIPITEEYIKGEFTISNRHYVVRDEATIKAIRKRSKRYLSLVRAGKLHPYVDILEIERILCSRISNSQYIV